MARQPRDITPDHDDDADFTDDLPAFSGINPGIPDNSTTRRTEAFLNDMQGMNQMGDGYVTVHSVDGQSEIRVRKEPADKHSYDDLVELIGRECGPGSYRFRLYIRGPKNRYVQADNKLETLGDTYKKSAQVSSDGLGDSAIARMMEQQNRNIDALVNRLSESKQFDVAKAVTIGTGVIAAVTPIIALFAARRPADPMAGLERMLTITGQMRELNGPQESAEGASPVLQAITAGMNALGGILAARGGVVNTVAGAAAPALAAPVAGMLTTAQSPQVAQRTTSGVLPDVSLFAAWVPNFIAAAQAGDSPEAAAATIVPQLPEAFHQQIFDLLDNPLFMKAMLQQTPEIIDVLDWMMYTRDELLSLLEASINAKLSPPKPDQPAGDTERDAGHSGYPQNDETLGQSVQN